MALAGYQKNHFRQAPEAKPLGCRQRNLPSAINETAAPLGTRRFAVGLRQRRRVAPPAAGSLA